MTEETRENGSREQLLDRPRAMVRLQGRRRLPLSRRPRTAAAVMSMVDLLSCAFGGALFLFMLTAAPPEQASAAQESRSQQGFVRIIATTRSVRPIFVMRHSELELSPVVVDPDRLKGASARREVRGATSNLEGGKVWTYGPTPWDVQPGEEVRPLYLIFDAPKGRWCLFVGLQDNDSVGRESGDATISAIDVRVQRPGDTAVRPIPVDSWVPLTSGDALATFSECIEIDFGT